MHFMFEDLYLVDPDEMPQCGISSWSSLFVKVPIEGFPVYKGFISVSSQSSGVISLSMDSV